MRLYLVQHGDALSKDADPRRPLSVTGRRQVTAVGRLLAGAGVGPARIIHSGKQRARETAELLAAALAADAAVTAMAGLDPSDPVEPIAQAVIGWATGALVVGHLPFLGRIVGRLLTGDEDRIVATFVPGTVLCLESGIEGHWAITWMVRPELAPGST